MAVGHGALKFVCLRFVRLQLCGDQLSDWSDVAATLRSQTHVKLSSTAAEAKIPVPQRHESGGIDSAAASADAACTPEEIYCYTQYNSLLPGATAGVAAAAAAPSIRRHPQSLHHHHHHLHHHIRLQQQFHHQHPLQQQQHHHQHHHLQQQQHHHHQQQQQQQPAQHHPVPASLAAMGINQIDVNNTPFLVH